jgi:hypothetical protein
MFTGRTMLAAAVAALGVFVPIGCSSGGGTSAPPPTLEPISVDVVTSLVMVTTTTLRPIDPALVDHCVQYVKFGAFTKNAMLTAMWDAAGQDDATLRSNCISLGRDDPAGLQALSDGWASVQLVLQSNSTTSTTVAPRAPRTTPAPPLATDAPVVDTTPPETTPEPTTATTLEPTATTVP